LTIQQLAYVVACIIWSVSSQTRENGRNEAGQLEGFYTVTIRPLSVLLKSEEYEQMYSKIWLIQNSL
jgi:hypothetical protein